MTPAHVASPFAAIRDRLGPGSSAVYDEGTNVTAAAALAAAADVAIVFVATLTGEPNDRTTLGLTDNGDALVAAVAAANPHTVVVAATPGSLLMPWRDQVASILVTFMPGEQNGNAIADVLFGDANPSGKLPLTFDRSENQTAMAPRQYPGVGQQCVYSEALLVGCKSDRPLVR